MFTLLQKELRSSAWLVGLALAAYGWLLTEMMGLSFYSRGMFPTREGFALAATGWLLSYGLVTAAFAGLLGLAMALDDGWRGTWQFVLFKPMSRRAYVAAKLVTGSLLTVLTAAVPVMVYTQWALVPGNVLAPFDWCYLQPSLEAFGWAVVVFLGGFLSGIRPASWWCSRLWPLATTIVLGLWLWLACQEEVGFPDLLSPTPTGYWICCVITATAFVVSIVHVVDERDFA